MLKGLKLAGQYIVSAGMVSTFLMGVVGTVSIDIVLLAYLIKKSNENNSGMNGFLTGYLWGTMFSGNYHHHHHHSHNQPLNSAILLMASPFLTGIAIGLSFLLGVPQVGIVLALGWGISLGIVGIGAGIIKLAEIGLGTPSEPAPAPNPEPEYNPINNTYAYVGRETQRNYPQPEPRPYVPFYGNTGYRYGYGHTSNVYSTRFNLYQDDYDIEQPPPMAEAFYCPRG